VPWEALDTVTLGSQELGMLQGFNTGSPTTSRLPVSPFWLRSSPGKQVESCPEEMDAMPQKVRG